MRQNNEKKEINEKRIDLQSLQGKLCVALYEKAGNEGLEVIKKIEIQKTVADGDEFCLGIVKLAGNV